MTAPHNFEDVAVVTLRCAANRCTRWQSANPRHLANLLAGGPWRCPGCKWQQVGADDAELQEPPC